MNSRFFSSCCEFKTLLVIPNDEKNARKIHIKSNDVQKCDAYHHSIYYLYREIDRYKYYLSMYNRERKGKNSNTTTKKRRRRSEKRADEQKSDEKMEKDVKMVR